MAARLVSDYEEGIARMTRAVRTLEPQAPMARHYDARFATYVDLIDRLREFWAGLDAARQPGGTAP